MGSCVNIEQSSGGLFSLKGALPEYSRHSNVQLGCAKITLIQLAPINDV